MSSLTASLSIGTKALFAAQAEIQNADNNIANANTPGYTREIVELQSLPPANRSGAANPGSGVTVEGFHSVRNSLLQAQIEQETQAQGQANAELSSLQQIQTIFNFSTQDIGTEMSALFTAISNLSTTPNDATARESVIQAGQNLASAFNTVSGTLEQQQSGLNTRVAQDVDQINSLAQQIAALNSKIATSGQSDSGILEDQQNRLVIELSKLTGVSVTKSESGVTLTLGNGAALVVGSTAHAVQTSTGAGGMTQILDWHGNDITGNIEGGDLGGTIQTRDRDISGLLDRLDSLAYQFATAFNIAQASGFDRNGAPGGNFFSIPSGPSGASGAIRMLISDPSLIAASSDGTAGSNGNLANFSALQKNPLPLGQTPTDAYAGVVYQVGSLTANADTRSKATTASLIQLQDQWNSVSGVSIDEETIKLIQYQQAYEAAARVISTIQSLFQITMTMGTASAA